MKKKRALVAEVVAVEEAMIDDLVEVDIIVTAEIAAEMTAGEADIEMTDEMTAGEEDIEMTEEETETEIERMIVMVGVTEVFTN